MWVSQVVLKCPFLNAYEGAWPAEGFIRERLTRRGSTWTRRARGMVRANRKQQQDELGRKVVEGRPSTRRHEPQKSLVVEIDSQVRHPFSLSSTTIGKGSSPNSRYRNLPLSISSLRRTLSLTHPYLHNERRQALA